jgi:hypothetical protein
MDRCSEIVNLGASTNAKHRAMNAAAENGHLLVVEFLLNDCIACNAKLRSPHRLEAIDVLIVAKEAARHSSIKNRRSHVAEYLLGYNVSMTSKDSDYLATKLSKSFV